MSLLARAQGPLRRWSFAYLGCVVAFAVVAALLAIRDHFSVPYVDDWRLLDDYQSLPLLDYLFTPQRGHHVPVTLALFALDYEFFGGRGRLLVVSSLICVGLVIGLLYRVFRDHDRLSGPASRMAFGFACFSFLWAVSCHDLLWGINQINLQAVVLLILCLAILARAQPAAAGAAWRPLGLAALCALLATFSHGIGAATWAALIVVAAVRGFPWRVVAGLAAGAAAIAVLRGLMIPPHPDISFGRSFAVALAEPLSLAKLAPAMLGSAPARVALGLGDGMPRSPDAIDAWSAYAKHLYTTALGFGAAGVVLFGALAFSHWRKTSGGALRTFAIGLMAFGIAGALLVVFVRFLSSDPVHAVAIRWVTWSALFWIGASVALLVRRGEGAPRPLVLLAALLLPVVSACMIPALQDARALHAMRNSQASKLTLALLLDIHHDGLARSVALDEPDLVYRVAERLEREGRHPFDDARRALRGATLRDRFAEAGSCSGGLAATQPVPTRGPPAAKVRGWITRTTKSAPPRFVVLTDAAGVIHGLGSFAAAAPQPGGARSGSAAWAGFIADYRAAGRYTAHAVLADGRSVCRLEAVP